RHLRDDAIAFCEEARRLRPDITFGADLIAGFPTETDAMFGNSLKLIDDCGLTWLHIFPYSPRPGTPAARMPQVNGSAIRDRAARLRAAGQAAVARHLDAQLGREHPVLMEAPDLGRTPHFAEVRFGAPQPTGQIVTARISGHDGTRLAA
ncbi:MAG: tRNA (N(6)-L-threonylcarbamoyladenosine(37)-C(2))-methylthiotransferase MtaB, partial [Rhodobacteraceae bacterium]|nr:tRNA (N(6)-L-threonylcarbamoyladenosine(37)-C(2))-methylthiotransferase MtaB [Paracoccaceae bacterium]